MSNLRRIFQLTTALTLVALAVSFSRADAPAKTITAKNGLVVSVSPEASDAGLTILKRGGNAVDAAVATALALAVTHPAAGNIGGGGFMLVHPAPGKGPPAVIEYRETAPAAATKDMFVNDDRHFGCKVVGVPGTVRGLEVAFAKYGSKAVTWKDAVTPAIELAEKGFALDGWTANSLNGYVRDSADFPEFCRVFGKTGGWHAGDRLAQPDLAKCLWQIAEQGAEAFYSGPVADLIVAEMRAGGGLITKVDLADYKAVERAPVHGTYRGYDVYAPPPPTSGGIALIEMLNVLENFDLARHGRFEPETLHLMAEAMRRAYCDRARFLGDPAFTRIPDHLTSKEYAKQLAASIDPAKSTPSESLAKDVRLQGAESDDTTHFSVIDKDGMAVSNTYTLEHLYGSKVVVRGGGFLLNNEMMDFNHKPGVTSRGGRIGTDPNLTAPGKRMLSSQTPTVVAKGGKPYLVTGSPGGRTITNTTLCVLVNVLDYKMSVREAVDAPRIHHQWFPDQLRVEPKLDAEAVEGLRKLGHKVSTARQGDAHTILIDPVTGAYYGADDRRIMGGAAGY
jgi:gamma-glutamyltranspeptidase/glutathione hydrolase